jgi:hypothetical protein
MFLGDAMKVFILSTTEFIKKKHNNTVTVTCPYRDKKDASACILVEGPKGATDDSVSLFDRMLADVLAKLVGVQCLLTNTQLARLSAKDLAAVKAIQGTAGVHIM